jgi:hypothetical protein
VNTTASWVPMALAAPMITIEIRPAIKLYSMAVTPASLLMKRTKKSFIGKMPRCQIELDHAAATVRGRDDDVPVRVACGLIDPLKFSSYCQPGSAQFDRPCGL